MEHLHRRTNYLQLKMIAIICLILTLANTINGVNVLLQRSSCLMQISYDYNSTSFRMLSCFKFYENVANTTTKWDQCTKLCCDPDKQYETVQLALNVCEEDRKKYNEKISKKEQKISISVLLTLAAYGILVLTLIGLAIKKMIEHFREKWKAQEDQAIRQAQANNLSLNAQQIKWFKSKKELNESCPICLQGKSNCEYSGCGHSLHGQCLIQWFKQNQNQNCVLCRGQNVTPLKIFCEVCFSAYFMVNKQEIVKSPHLFQQLCDSCKQQR